LLVARAEKSVSEGFHCELCGSSQRLKLLTAEVAEKIRRDPRKPPVISHWSQVTGD
jgi:hypothetical protein